jgi:hypothetical protein
MAQVAAFLVHQQDAERVVIDQSLDRLRDVPEQLLEVQNGEIWRRK